MQSGVFFFLFKSNSEELLEALKDVVKRYASGIVSFFFRKKDSKKYKAIFVHLWIAIDVWSQIDMTNIINVYISKGQIAHVMQPSFGLGPAEMGGYT